jgi:hypothetical protein
MDDLTAAFSSFKVSLNREDEDYFPVDRNRSTRTQNSLSSVPGGKWAALVHDTSRGLKLRYDNIHYPRAYAARLMQNSDIKVTMVPTETRGKSSETRGNGYLSVRVSINVDSRGGVRPEPATKFLPV